MTPGVAVQETVTTPLPMVIEEMTGKTDWVDRTDWTDGVRGPEQLAVAVTVRA